MNETRELLERVGGRFTFPERAFEALQRRRDRKRRNQRIAAGAVGIAIFVAAIWIVTAGGSFDRAQTPAGTGPTAPLTSGPHRTSDGSLDGPGARTISRTVEGVPFSFRVHTHGWEAKSAISMNKSIVGPQGAEAMIFWTSFPDGGRTYPCAAVLGPSVGPSAADLAAAVATAPGTDLVAGPSDISVGGLAAKHVVLTIRENVGCDPGFFYGWLASMGGALFTNTTVGDTIEVWIVDVDGTRLVLEAVTTTEADVALEQEIQQIVGSVRFEEPSPT